MTSDGWWKKLRWGCGTLAQQTISQTILHNKSNRQGPSYFTFSVSAKCLLSNGHWSRDCTELGSCPELITPESTTLLSRNWKLRHYRPRDQPYLSSLGRQKNRPFQLRFEDADWLNCMSHLEYIYILNQDLTKFDKDPPPVGDFSIWNWDVLTGREVILWWWKHIFFTEDFLIHHIIQIYI